MYDPQTIERLRDASAQRMAAESADTTITVNNHGRTANMPPPVLHSHPGSNPYHSAPATITNTTRSVNWGGVLKGVALVTGVVLVGVAAITFVPPLVGSGLTWLGANTFLGGAINATVPALTWLADMGMASVLFVANFFGGLFAPLTASAGAAAAAGTLVAPATAAAISTGTGAVVAGGAVAVAAPLAAKAIMTTSLVDTVHHVSPITGLEDGGASAHAGAQHHASNHASNHNTHTPSPLNDLPDLPDEVLFDQARQHAHQQQHAMEHTSQKLAHHSAHSNEGHQANHDSADATPDAHESHDRRARMAISNSAHASQAWADRVGQRQAAAVTPRASQFSSQLHEERERLDAALGQNHVG